MKRNHESEQEIQEYDDLGEMVRSLGFASEEEFHRLVCAVNLQTQFQAFNRWQDEDGTKQGLINVINNRKYDDNGL